ncbi:MAG: FtsX-like permease family protein [Candidatus Eisenbacteria bacterium]
MRLLTLVLREMFERKTQVVTGLLAVLLGIAVIVAVKNISFYSEKAVSREMDALGANVLVLPKSVTIQDYYSADMQEAVIPEEYVTRLVMSDIQGLDNLSPKLSVPVEVSGRRLTLTGILPKQEFQAKAMWAGAGIFARPEGCGTVPAVSLPGGASGEQDPSSLARRRVIEDLGVSEALVGSDVSSLVGVEEGDEISVLGRQLSVLAVLPRTGTVDDARIFAHLHTVQEMTGRGAEVNAIEVVGCCQAISDGLVEKVNRLLPEAQVLTIAQIVDTQVRMNETMRRLSTLIVAVIAAIGAFGIANYMFTNVTERRREIGVLVALGASPRFVTWVFLLKGLILGLAGGLGGFLLGTALAVWLGPALARIPVLPMPQLLLWAMLLSVGISLVGSFLPSRRAIRMDPSDALQEV